ncbi:hypothetical protein CLV58_1271 [Spirosoma oryzae]|uniref:SD-repeat containing protein B domain-containing protein n=1 Tax=Spirosoma oryzae TaxID=1469603 RepID=A0A2T0S6M8_9BACT|nr:hypothetical protein CLV58_1271 [Spirosoma oryzae]
MTCTTGVVSFTVTPAVTASPDAGTASAGTGGTPVANVAANDVVNGQPATLGNGGNATVAQVGNYPTGISLNPANGSLLIAAGTAPGSYTVAYQLCDRLSTPTCSTAVVSLTVTASSVANPDAGTVSAGTGGTPVANIAANDVVNGQPANLATGGNATVSLINPPAGITLNSTNGSISVAAGTVPGSYTVAYQLCDKLTPATCTTSIVSLTVTPSSVAMPDAGTVSSGTNSTAVANVAANDFVNGQPATLGTNGNATVAQVGTYPPGVTLDPTTGSLTVAQGTTPGSYTVAYQLCDKLTPATCSTAIVSFIVTASEVANPDAGTISSATGGTAIANVVANDVVDGLPATLGANGNATVTLLTTGTPLVLNTNTGSVSVAQGTTPGVYTTVYQLCDKITPVTCTTGTISVTVTAAEVANPDAGTVSAGNGGVVVANVAANDMVDGLPATVGPNGNATVAQVGTYPAGVTLDPNTGSLSVAAGTAPGSYTVAYQLCDKLTPVTCTTGVVSFTITPGVGGTVFNDANGLTDNQINGPGTNAGGLFAILTNSANTVVASVPVATTGAYRFDNVAPGSYGVRISTAAGIVGGTPPAVSLPTNWTTTGEGTTTGGDGLVDGITSVTVGSAEVSGANFGIEQLPTPATTALAARSNPGGTNAITVPPSSLTGTDPDGAVVAIRFVSFPTNVTTLFIGGTSYTAATFPAGGVTTASNVPVHIDPIDGTNGAVASVISFRVIDNAGMESRTTGTATLSFSCPDTLCVPVTIQKIRTR